LEQVKHSGIALDLASDAKNYAYFFVELMDEIPTFVVDPLAGKDHVRPFAIVNNNNTSFYL